MKPLFIAIIIFLLGSQEARSQNFKGIFKNIENKEYNKAINQLTNARKDKTPNLYAINLANALMYEDTSCSKFCLPCALISLNDALIFKDQNYYADKNLDISYDANTEMNKLIELWYKIAKSSEDSLNYFIQTFPNATQITDAIKLRDDIAFKKAVSQNTVDAYSDFLKKYPKAIQFQEAINKKTDAAFENAKATGTEEAFSNFLNQYNGSSHTLEASKLMKQIAFDNAAKQNTVESYDIYLKKYPESENSYEAQQRIYKIAFTDASNANTIVGYEDYIRNYKSSPYLKNIIELRDSAAFMYAEFINSQNSFCNFIIEYPDSKEYTQAVNELIKIANSSYTQTDFLVDKNQVAKASQLLSSHTYCLCKYPSGDYYLNLTLKFSSEKLAPIQNMESLLSWKSSSIKNSRANICNSIADFYSFKLFEVAEGSVVTNWGNGHFILYSDLSMIIESFQVSASAISTNLVNGNYRFLDLNSKEIFPCYDLKNQVNSSEYSFTEINYQTEIDKKNQVLIANKESEQKKKDEELQKQYNQTTQQNNNSYSSSNHSSENNYSSQQTTSSLSGMYESTSGSDWIRLFSNGTGKLYIDDDVYGILQLGNFAFTWTQSSDRIDIKFSDDFGQPASYYFYYHELNGAMQIEVPSPAYNLFFVKIY